MFNADMSRLLCKKVLEMTASSKLMGAGSREGGVTGNRGCPSNHESHSPMSKAQRKAAEKV